MHEFGQESPEQLPSPVELFNDLTSQVAIVNFDHQIHEEMLAFNQEKGHIEAREERLSYEIQQVYRDPDLSDEERESRYEALKVDLGDAMEAMDKSKKKSQFMALRENIFRSRGWLSYEASDSKIRPLIESVIANSVTDETKFINDQEFMNLVDETKPTVIVESDDNPIEIPTSALVSAIGFSGWQEGRGRGYKGQHILKDGKLSTEVIHDYATRESDIPNIDATGVILPDGKVVFLAENSHRAAAAKLRGQSTIKVNRLTLWLS